MYVYECFCAVYIFNVSKVSRQNVILGNGHMTGAERTRTTTSIETKNLSTRGEEVSEMVVEQQQQKKIKPEIPIVKNVHKHNGTQHNVTYICSDTLCQVVFPTYRSYEQRINK